MNRQDRVEEIWAAIVIHNPGISVEDARRRAVELVDAMEAARAEAASDSKDPIDIIPTGDLFPDSFDGP